MEQKCSKWFNKIHKKHLNFLLGFEMYNIELESNIDKRHEDTISYLKGKEKVF